MSVTFLPFTNILLSGWYFLWVLSGRFVLQVLSLLLPPPPRLLCNNQKCDGATVTSSSPLFDVHFVFSLPQRGSETQGVSGSCSAPEPRAAHPGRAYSGSGPGAQGQVCTRRHAHAHTHAEVFIWRCHILPSGLNNTWHSIMIVCFFNDCPGSGSIWWRLWKQGRCQSS